MPIAFKNSYRFAELADGATMPQCELPPSADALTPRPKFRQHRGVEFVAFLMISRAPAEIVR